MSPMTQRHLRRDPPLDRPGAAVTTAEQKAAVLDRLSRSGGDQGRRPPTPPPTAAGEPRRVTCRYLRGHGNTEVRCTAEAVDEDAEIELCTRHLAAAWRIIQQRMPGAAQ